MNNLVIWSKDRAAQLELLLRTIYSQPYQLFDYINVIYKYTDQHYELAYNQLKVEYNHVQWWSEENVNFEQQTNNAINTFKDCDNTYFSTDDTILYKYAKTKLPYIKYGECFSLRLELNTIIQNCHTGEFQPPLNKYIDNNDTISWNPHLYHPLHNYGYCFGLDMCGYNTIQLRNILKQISFKNTNQLESTLFRYKNAITTMNSFHKSIAVNIPYNNMSGITQAMNNVPNLAEINVDFLNGKRLQYQQDVNVIGCHQEIPLWMA